MRMSDWSSDVCSSDLVAQRVAPLPAQRPPDRAPRQRFGANGHLDHLTQCGGYFYVARAGRHAPARRSFRRACIEIAGPAGCGPKPPRIALGKADCIAQFDRAEGTYEKMGGAGVIEIAQQDRKSTRLNSSH